jgi:replicative DNA helicase
MENSSGAERLPPQNLEAEQSALGAMMLDREATTVGLEILRPEDFYRRVHGRIFEAISQLFQRGEPVDLVTLSNELQRQGVLDDVGGQAYLMTLVNSVPTASNIDRYAGIVADKAMLRLLISAARDITEWCYSDSDEVRQVVDRSEERLFRVTERRAREGFVEMGPRLRERFAEMDQDTHVKQRVPGVPTGFPDLDRLLGGLAPGTLNIVAGRPSMGKTSLAMNIAVNVGMLRDRPHNVAVFSLEMSREQLVEGALSAEARVNSHSIRLGALDPKGEWPRLAEALDRLYECGVLIDDSPGISTLEMRAKARRLQSERGVDLIVVDHLQLVTHPGRFDNRHQELSQIARGLKMMARELNVPVLVASQLSRSVERREDKRPILSDLMESGYIEAEADIVAFIYRPEYYKYRKRTEDGKEVLVGGPGAQQPKGGQGGQGGNGAADDAGADDLSKRDDTAEIIIAKNRTGPTGVCELVFSGKYRRFDSKAREGDGGSSPHRRREASGGGEDFEVF